MVNPKKAVKDFGSGARHGVSFFGLGQLASGEAVKFVLHTAYEKYDDWKQNRPKKPAKKKTTTRRKTTTRKKKTGTRK